MIIDSHCHLDMLDVSQYGGSMDAVIKNATDNGVEHMLCVSVRMDQFDNMIECITPYQQVSASVGLHPNETADNEPTMEEYLAYAKHERVVAIGETGLDYYRLEGDNREQCDRFVRHIDLAKQVAKPLIIHTRQAREDTIQILREHNASEVGGVLHCFTEDWNMASQAMDLGFYISFSGIVTFKNAKELQDVASRMPLERMLVETDSPYLAPMPYRGKPNQPSYVLHVAEFLAQLRGEDFSVIAKQTTQNYMDLFGRWND